MKLNDWAVLVGCFMVIIGVGVAAVAVSHGSPAAFIGICVAMIGTGVVREAIDSK